MAIILRLEEPLQSLVSRYLSQDAQKRATAYNVVYKVSINDMADLKVVVTGLGTGVDVSSL